MGCGAKTRRVAGVLAAAAGLAWGSAWLAVSAAAQTSAQASVQTSAQASTATSVTLTEPGAPLLPEAFGEWKKAASSGETPAYSLVNVNKDALEECGPQRSQVAEYTRGGREVHLEAIQFGDRTGATSAFTLVERPGMKTGSVIGSEDAVGDGAVLFMEGSSLVLANFGGAVTEADVGTLKPLAAVLPKIGGNKAVAPMLPTMVPAKGLVEGSVRYALGPASYAAEGGVLPANTLGWDKEPEVVTAQYDDQRGKETLTVLLYPTPTIAETLGKAIQEQVRRMGESLGTAIVRREGLLVTVAAGSFSTDAAQQMMGVIHLREMAFNQDVQPTFHMVAGQTFTLLENILILSGFLGAGAVLLGLFLGFGRATFRVMRGKPAAVEAEFLSLHLSPQNKPAQFNSPDSEQRR